MDAQVSVAGLWDSAEAVKNLVVNDSCHILDMPFITATWEFCLLRFMVLLGVPLNSGWSEWC